MADADAFLLLDNCDIYFAIGERNDNNIVETDTNPWHDVAIPSSRYVDNNDQHQHQHQQQQQRCDDESHDKSNADDDANGKFDGVDAYYCQRCYLILTKDPFDEKGLKINGLCSKDGMSNTTRNGYDGTIKDTKCNCGSVLQGQRSDAALMMGLALTSQDDNHIMIQSIKIGLYDKNRTSSNTKNTFSSTAALKSFNNNNHKYRKRKACLLIAFACREIYPQRQSSSIVTAFSISKRKKNQHPQQPLDHQQSQQQQRRHFFTESTKSLPASTQLILSIMRSDWRIYETKVSELILLRGKDKSKRNNRDDIINVSSYRKSNIQRVQKISFFPSKINLEDVFQRIGGASSSLLSDPKFCSERIKGAKTIEISSSNKDKCNAEQDKNDSDHKMMVAKLTDLPGDILCQGIGQYLRAKSLDALRCSCKHLHWTLRAVVPGLKLQLYSHQIKSLIWIRWRETKQINEDDLLMLTTVKPGVHQRKKSKYQSSQWIDSRQEGDAHRAATGGGTVVLYPRRQHRKEEILVNDDSDTDVNGAVRISQFDCRETIEICNHNPGSSGSGGGGGGGKNPLSRKVARGGLLCDDPGLGKTITVVSLILQTMGLSTETVDCGSTSRLPERTEVQSSIEGESSDVPSTGQLADTLSYNDERIFNEYWKEQIIPEFRCQALTKLFSTFLRSSRDINIFFDNYWMNELKGIQLSEHPLSLKDIRVRIDKSIYGDSLQGFVSDVESCFRNVISNSCVSSLVEQAAIRLLSVFRSQIKAFKQSQLETAIKSFSRSSAKPDSIVAALIEKTSNEHLKHVLLPSSATLLVVPAVLVDHWVEQLKLNIDVLYCTGNIPLVFEFTGSSKTEQRIGGIMLKCRVKKTHFPFIFVDRATTKKLPPPSFLAMFKIVITSNNRFSSEWKNGSFKDEIRRKSNRNNGKDSNGRIADFREDLATSEDACPLLKVNWLRMIVDEGHSMGRGRDNSSISFASWVNSERRWAMTGTPTPQTSTSSGLINILNLMQYLQHDFFTRRHGGDIIWNQLIVRGWNRGFVSSFFRLRSLLSLLMIRHVKSNILELPLPIFNINTISMGIEEVSTYNTLVCAIQSNLLITSMKGKTSGAQDSLLHKSQTRHAREALSNLRLVCAGGTQVRPTLTDEYWIEFHQDFDNCNADPIQQKKIKQFISRATTGQRSSCDLCSVMLSTLLVFSCGHLVCTECVDSNITSCIVCNNQFDVDLFQRLQPGFKYDWLHNVEEEIKLEPTNNQENLQDVDEPLPLPGGVGVLVPRNQRQRRARTHKFGDGHSCEYDPKNSSGRCILCFTEHESCYLAGELRCNVCFRLAQNCPRSESKITHIVNKLLDLYRHQQDSKLSTKNKNNRLNKPAAFLLERKRIPKVIVFSQFRKVLNLTGDRLLRRFGSGCIAEYWGKYRKKELSKFIKDEKCLCMLLGKDGSEGLDLSFVTNIIFLEQVWDKSLENQVVARAWRMGANGSVNVEILVAESSIEETMFLLEKSLEREQGDGNICNTSIHHFRSTAIDRKCSEYQQAKVRYLLNNLKLIADTSTLGFNIGNECRESLDSEMGDKRQISGMSNLVQRNGQKKLRVQFQEIF